MPKFEKGNPGGPGRPKGSKHRLSEAFISALSDDFDEHGIDALVKMREDKPADYIKVVASLLPKEMSISHAEDMTDEQLNGRIRELATKLAEDEGIDIGPVSEVAH